MTDIVRYPQMLYRDDAQRVVADEAEHAEAAKDGWLTWDQRFAPDPLDHDGDGRKGGAKRKAPR